MVSEVDRLKLEGPSWTWALWACALLPRILCAVLAGTRNDDMDEMDVVRNLLAGRGFMLRLSNGVIMRSSWPPGFPYLMTGYIKTFGMNWPLFHIGMAVLGSVVCWLVYRIGQTLLDERSARLAAFWLALYPPQFFWATRMNPRSIDSHLLVLIVFLLATRRNTNLLQALGLGVLWAILALFRAEYAPGILLAVAFLFLNNRETIKKVTLPICLMAGFVLTLSPWLARNWQIYHRISISSNFGVSFYYAFNPRYDFTGNSHDQDLMKQMLAGGMSEVQIEKCYFRTAAQYIQQNPAKILTRTLAGNFLNFWRPYLSPAKVSWKENLLYVVSWLPIFVFFLLGIFRVPWREPRWTLVGMIIVYQCLIHLPFYMVVHFREIIAPFLILVAAAGLAPHLPRTPGKYE